MMRALVYDSYGSPDELHVEDVPLPQVGAGDVRVRAVASSINDWDRDLLRGEPLNRAIAPLRPRHRVLGADAAGVVESVAPDVVGLSPGDEVMADLSPYGFGGFAEYAVAPASAWSAIPAGLSLEQAASVPQAGGLAVTGLRSAQPLTQGQRIAICGAGGGVGTFAVQIAKAGGAHVTAVDAAWKLDALLALGADRVVDYASEDFTAAPAAYDAIVEISAHHAARDYHRALAPGGVCSILGGEKRRMLSALTTGSVLSAVSDRRVHMPRWLANDPRDVAYLRRLLVPGDVQPVIDSVVELDAVPDALRRLSAQQHVGKIVVRI
jgi:NADPH:quinone reductase-like Zn-dependent oxidoreductase